MQVKNHWRIGFRGVAVAKVDLHMHCDVSSKKICDVTILTSRFASRFSYVTIQVKVHIFYRPHLRTFKRCMIFGYNREEIDAQ